MAQGGRAVAVAEPSGDGPQIDAGNQQLGGGVVPELLELGVDPESSGEACVSARDRAWITRLAEVRLRRE